MLPNHLDVTQNDSPAQVLRKVAAQVDLSRRIAATPRRDVNDAMLDHFRTTPQAKGWNEDVDLVTWLLDTANRLDSDYDLEDHEFYVDSTLTTLSKDDQ